MVISHRVAGADYEGLTVDDSVTVTVTDNDQPGIHVDPAMAEVTEGRTANLDVKLNALPTGNVTVTLTVPSGVSASDTTLTFTTGNWSTAQTVMVTALDDDDALPRPTATTDFTIGFAATGADYAGVTESFVLKVLEDDTEEIPVEPDPLEFGEGGSGTFMVKLASQPAGPVTVGAALGANPDPSVTLSPATRQFTPSNWGTAQSFTVAGAEGRGLRRRHRHRDLRGRCRQLRGAGRAGRGDGHRQRRSLDRSDAHRRADRRGGGRGRDAGDGDGAARRGAPGRATRW